MTFFQKLLRKIKIESFLTQYVYVQLRNIKLIPMKSFRRIFLIIKFYVNNNKTREKKCYFQ